MNDHFWYILMVTKRPVRTQARHDIKDSNSFICASRIMFFLVPQCVCECVGEISGCLDLPYHLSLCLLLIYKSPFKQFSVLGLS